MVDKVKNVEFDIFDDAVNSVVGSDYFRGMVSTIVGGNDDISICDYYYSIDGSTVIFNIDFNTKIFNK